MVDALERTGPQEPRNCDLTDAERAQAPVVAYLKSGAAFGGTPPRHITTHMSHVFLGATRALKLKRAIRFSFADHSTLTSRVDLCQKEVAINTRFAGDLYRGVRKITRQGNTLDLDGQGEVIDAVVDMQRFAEGDQFDELAARGALTPTLIDQLADIIAATHRAAPASPRSDATGGLKSLAEQLTQDVGAVLKAPRATQSTHRDHNEAALARWAETIQRVITRHSVKLERRARHGFIKRCHGDLHLSNICLWKGRPTLFDAIEFSEEIATVDVLYDVAFVLVDLNHRGFVEDEHRLLSRYLSQTRDYGGLEIVPLFQSLRAMVRALTAGLKDRDPTQFLAEALGYATRTITPRVLAVGGLSGSGKSVAAHAIAPVVGGVIIRSDLVTKRFHKVAPEAPLPPSAYTAESRAGVYRRAFADARKALNAGFPVILDATFTGSPWRDAAQSLAKEVGVPFQGFWLTAPPEVLKSRVRARQNDPSDANANVIDRQVQSHTPPTDWVQIDASAKPDAVAEAMGNALDRR